MKIEELQYLITNNLMDNITFFRPAVMSGQQSEGWEIWGYCSGTTSHAGGFENRLQDKDGKPILHKSINEAYKFVRHMGWSRIIEIDG